MKEVKVEKVTKTFDIYWEAVDGTRFTSKEECQKYDESAKGVLKARLMGLTIYKQTEYELLHGSDDTTIYGVRLAKEEDKDVILQLYLLDNGWINNDNNHNKYLERAKYLIDSAYKNNDILLVGENYDGDFFICDTCQNIVDRLYNKKQEEDKQQ